MRAPYWIMAITCLAFFGLVAISLLKVPVPKEADCLLVSGTVTAIYEAGDKDIVFKLQEHKNTFYINRGLERGLNLPNLKAVLLYKEILIKFPRHFSVGTKHISKIEAAGKTIFTELKN